MSDKIYLSALGAGQEIGASCYSLEIGGSTILLDCGRCVRNGFICGPDFTCLLNRNKSPAGIENVFISHAHYDHIGYLTDLFRQCGHIPIYTSRLTAELGHVLLWDNAAQSISGMTPARFEQYKKDLNDAFAAINKCEYCSPIDFGSYKVTFYEAGHIPGAAMIYVETDSESLLFTGDFSLDPTMLTNGAVLPDGLKADTVIIDGTFAKRPGYRNYSMFEKSTAILRDVIYHPLAIKTSQLTKGIELISLILKKMDQGDLPQVRLYIDDNLWNVAQAFAAAKMQVLNSNCYRFSNRNIDPKEKAVYITTKGLANIMEVPMDYSLHAGFDDLKKFIDMHAADKVVVVHSPASDDYSRTFSLEDACSPKLNFIYPETGETYLI